jgi:hypothetical protein
MQAKERLKKEIESLDPHNILRVYDLVLTLKNQNKKAKAKKEGNGFLRTRLASQICSLQIVKKVWCKQNAITQFMVIGTVDLEPEKTLDSAVT